MGIPSRSYYPPVPPAIYDWTGIYVGGHIGGGILVDSVSQNGVSPGGFNFVNTSNLNPAGVIGGGQVGANYEFVPASGGLSVDRHANGYIGADHKCAIAVGRRLHGRRHCPIAGRGAGVFLQKGNALVYCYVTEKPGSAALDTQYCKPVK